MDFVIYAADFYRNLLNSELHINEWVQERLSFGEPFWHFISVYLEPGNLMNIFIPLAGIFRQDILIHMVSLVSLVSTLNSFEKWVYPEMRPLWWLREIYANDRAIKPKVALSSHELSCETSGGMPCSHSMSFTVFIMIIASYSFTYCHRRFQSCSSNMWRVIAYSLIAISVFCVWLSRLYFATEFLHQCILGSYFGIRVLNFYENHTEHIYSCKRLWAILMVSAVGCISVAVYFVKLRFDLDPHWSVRQAFKWCSEPLYMRHEASPIFLLSRDLGILMGLALSSPLTSLRTYKSTFWRRFLAISLLELINLAARFGTPKQYGRFVFLAYEFVRNCVHSLVLVKYMSRLK